MTTCPQFHIVIIYHGIWQPSIRPSRPVDEASEVSHAGGVAGEASESKRKQATAPPQGADYCRRARRPRGGGSLRSRARPPSVNSRREGRQGRLTVRVTQCPDALNIDVNTRTRPITLTHERAGQAVFCRCPTVADVDVTAAEAAAPEKRNQKLWARQVEDERRRGRAQPKLHGSEWPWTVPGSSHVVAERA